MQITIDTTVPLTALDRALIQGLLGETTVAAPAPAKAAPKAAEKPAPAPKPEPAPAPKPEPAPAPKPEPAPEPEPEEDLLGDSTDGPTVEEAIEMATKLVGKGDAAKVKAALTAVGLKKVSELKASTGVVADFAKALEA